MPRIPELPTLPASVTVTGSNQLAIYDAGTDRTYGGTVTDVADFIIAGGGGVPEAPADSIAYARYNDTWIAATEEAPSDSLLYARYNGDWTAIYQIATMETVSGTTQTPAVGVAGRYFICTNAAGCAVTIPANATQAFPVGTMLTYQQDGAAAVTFTAAGGVTLRVPAAYQASTAEQYAVVQVAKTATNTWTLYGHLLAV